MGILDDNIKEVIEVKPKKYLAIIPFGTGNKFNRENGASTKKEYTNFLVSLGFNENSFDIAQAAPKSSTGHSNDFDKPWVWTLESDMREMSVTTSKVYIINLTVILQRFHLLCWA